jgi:hypothetical protein
MSDSELPSSHSSEEHNNTRATGVVPAASLSFLIQTLGSQALVSLGLIPSPMTNKSERHLDQAQHFIDMLDVLEQKTAGNRTPEESEFLSTWLHQLRLAFIEARKA